MLEFINSQKGILLLTVAITALVQLARLLSASTRPTWWALLPAWADVTTWPRLLQLAPAVVLAGGTVVLAQLQAGALPLDALWAGAQAAGLVLLEYHGGKKVAQSLSGKRPPAGPTAVATVTLALFLTGCSALQSQPVQTATGVLDVACATGLVQSVALQEQAKMFGVTPAVLADWLCRVPEVVEALGKARQARSVDPGEEAVAAARKAGVL